MKPGQIVADKGIREIHDRKQKQDAESAAMLGMDPSGGMKGPPVEQRYPLESAQHKTHEDLATAPQPVAGQQESTDQGEQTRVAVSGRKSRHVKTTSPLAGAGI